MNKLITTFMLLFFYGILMNSIMEGGGGIASTRLTVAATPASTTFNVDGTAGFLKYDYFYIGNEMVHYTDTTVASFTGGTRAYNGTTAVAHAVGEFVYSPGASMINAALGFNVASTGTTVGAIDIPIALSRFIFVTMPMIVTWNYSWLQDGSLIYLRLFLAVISTGFIIYMVYQGIAMSMGFLLQRIFNP